MAKTTVPIKMNIDNSSSTRRRKIAATGAYSMETMTKVGDAASELSSRSYAMSHSVKVPITKNAQFAGSAANAVWAQPMFFSPLHTPQNWQIASKRREIYQWSRFYYMNEPKVAAGVDFYANFSMNGFKLECKKKKILKHFERVADKLELAERLNEISHEYFLLGDVFPFLEIDCPHCHGGGVTKNGKPCMHPDGSFKSVKILNPDYMDVKTNSIANDPKFFLKPDEELKMLVSRKEPRELYESLPQELIDLVSTGQDIPLSDRSISHIRHNASPYGTFGVSMLQRLFTMLAYKTKIMTANWIIAERLILPVRVVKVGDEKRPATEEDLQDVVGQLGAVANDPNLTIVTHHAFDYEWYGACFPDDENIEILTYDGWKTHNNIAKEEQIATYNKATKKMEFQNYTEKFEYNYDSTIHGDLYKFGGKCMNIQVTPNHRMYTRKSLKHNYETVMSQDIKPHYKFLSQIEWEGCVPKNLPFKNSPLSHLSMKEFLKFAGYYLSEGHAKIEYNKNLSKECEIQALGITQKVDSKCYQDIKNISEKVYKNASIHIDSRGAIPIHTFMINSVDIARYMEKEFSHGSSNKKMPRWILTLPNTFLQIILESLMNGDGCVIKNNNYTKLKYTTASKELSNNVSEILVKLGFSPTVSFCKGNKSKQRGDVYNVYWSDFKSLNERQVQNIEKVPYKGKVWCYSVPNEFLVVRFHGRVFVIGNSGKIHNITQEMEHIGKEILDGLMLNQAILNGEMGGYNCMDERTLTLTNSGFKKYDEITKDDKIACYNPDTKKLEYHPYKEKWVYDYEGEMVHFQTDKIDFLCTPNHKMYTKKRDGNEYEFIEAKDVKNRARFIGAVNGFEGEYQKSIEIGEEEYTIYDFCKLIGYYVSEGWTKEEKRKNRTQKCTTIQIGQNKSGKARNDINDLFNDMFETHYDNDESVSVYKPALAEYLKINFGHGAKNKRLSSFVKNLAPECLEIVIESMINGDGCECNKIDRFRKNTNLAYYTSSPQLAKDFAEISFKCGYSVKISERTKKENDKRYFNKTGHEYITKHQQYIVYISKGFKGRNPVLASKSKKYANREISREEYKGKVYCFEVPYNLFVTMRNGKIAIQGNSAQVGIEVLIRRLDNWRNKLKDWVEKHIFLPIAMMQGFIDEDESALVGETVYMYPKLVWNDLQLRDKTNKIQTLMQWYDKGGVSMQTICEELDLDYDAEIEKIREEQVMAGPQGQIPGGGNLGTMGMGGDMGGGMPGGDMGGGMPGGDMGGGMPGGGMPGGDMGGAPPMGGGMAAAAENLPKITKRGGGQEQEQEVAPPQAIKFTKLEQKMLKILQQIPSPHEIFAQYQVRVPGEQRPFVLDFAYPQIGIGVETDGAIWHQREDFQQRDLIRDQKLANIGWRVLRFRDDAVEEQSDAVRQVIAKNMVEATRAKKAANDTNSIIKYSSTEGIGKNPIYDYMVANKGKVGINVIEMPNKMGQLILIGTV